MVTLFSILVLIQPPAKGEGPKQEARPSIAKLWSRLKDLQADQRAQLKKITDDYAAQIAELEAERDQRLASLLSKPQREELAAMVAEDVDRYRVVLQVKFARPGQVAKQMREILGLDAGEAMARLNAAPPKPLAENLPRAKAEALVKALTAAGAKAVMEKHETSRP